MPFRYNPFTRNLDYYEPSNVLPPETGEANTAINVGLGAGVYFNKDDVELQFRSLVSNSALITITEDGNTLDFDFDDTELNANTAVRHTHTNLPLLETIIDSGDGASVLANDGNYVTNNDGKVVNPAQWDDLRVAVFEATEIGSNPPVSGIFKNDGTGDPGTTHAIEWLSNNTGILNIPDAGIYNWQNAWTFEFWYYPVPATANNRRYIRKNNVFQITSGASGFPVLNITGVGTLVSPVGDLVNDWNHMLVTYDGVDTFEMHINSVSAGFLIGSGISTNNNDIEFNDQEILWSLDAIVLWDKLLSPNEIVVRYNNSLGAPLVGDEANVVGLWALDDGTGTTAIDSHLTGNDATLSGTEDTHWSWIGGHVGAPNAGSKGVVVKYFDYVLNNDLFFAVQMPHHWAEGTEIRPHVHWVGVSDGGTAEKPRWGLEYNWSNINTLFGDTTIIYGGRPVSNGTAIDVVADQHHITSLGSIDGTGQTLSSMLLCRIFRDAQDSEDDYSDFAGLIEIDFHYQIDSSGSNQEFIK